jgi:hypothetical protein
MLSRAECLPPPIDKLVPIYPGKSPREKGAIKSLGELEEYAQAAGVQ